MLLLESPHCVSCRYYLNGVDAFRLKLLLPVTQERLDEIAAEELKQMSLSTGGAEIADSSTEQHSDQEQPQVTQHAALHNEDEEHTQSQQSHDSDELLQRLAALQT